MLKQSLLILFLFLPFQFALNPAVGVDLAFLRVFIPLLFLFWLIISLKNKSLQIPTDKAALFLYSFLFICCFSLLFSQNLGWSFRKLAFLFSLFPVFILTNALISTKKRFYKALSFLILGATILSLVGILQFIAQFIFGIDTVSAFLIKYITPFFLGDSFSNTVNQYPSWLVNIGGRTYMRAIAVFPDPHMLAFFLGMIFPWSIALTIHNEKKSLLYGFSAFLIITCDILTFSRGGYLGLAFGLIILLLLNFKKNTQVLKLFFCFLLIIIPFLIFTKNPILDRFYSSFNPAEGSNSSRILIWKEGFTVLLKNPLGVGLGNFPLAVKPSAVYREPIYAHMLYLDIALETGLLGLIFWLLLIYSILRTFYLKSKDNPIYLAGFFSIIIFSSHSLVESPLFSIHILTLFLIISALGVKNIYMQKNA